MYLLFKLFKGHTQLIYSAVVGKLISCVCLCITLGFLLHSFVSVFHESMVVPLALQLPVSLLLETGQAPRLSFPRVIKLELPSVTAAKHFITFQHIYYSIYWIQHSHLGPPLRGPTCCKHKTNGHGCCRSTCPPLSR